MFKRILSIDNDTVFGLIVQKMFENNNKDHRIVTTNSVSQGIAYLEEVGVYDYPNIILVDVNLLVGGAFQFIDLYKRSNLDMYDADIHFISSTEFTEDQQKVTDSSLIKSILKKPFNQEKVDKMLS